MKLSNRIGAFAALSLSFISSVLASQTCSQLSGRDYTDGPNGRNFEILCDTSTIGGHILAYYSNGDEFQDCVDRCDYDSNCNVALFLQSSGDCALIDTYQGTRPFNGNDLAIFRPAPIPTTTSVEPSSAEPTTTEAATTEDATTEATSSEASTTETTSVETTSVETTSAETTATESSTNEPSSSETTSADTTSTVLTEIATSTIDLSTTQSSTTGASSTEPSPTNETSSETSSIVQDSTTVSTTDSSYTSIATTEASTDDCDDETSSYEAPTTSVDSTSTGTQSDGQPMTSSTQSLSGSTSIPESSEPSTWPYSTFQTVPAGSTSLTATTEASVPIPQSTSVTSQEVSSISASSKSTTTQIYAPPSQVTSLTGSETQESGSKTLPSSGVTTMKTTTEGRLPTYAPASDCVWTVYLTMVKYVTCSTGVVPETSTTATYVTVDGSAVTYGPPVIQLPSGCIGGYQVDASGHSYPVVQPTMGSQGYSSGEKNHPSVRPTQASPGGFQPSAGTGQYHVPAPTAGSQGPHLPEQGTEKPSIHPTQGSQGNSHDSMNQPPVSDQDSPEHNGGEPHRTQGEAAPTAISAYHSGSPAYPSLISPIHQGQHNTSMTFTVKTATSGGVGEHKASSSSSAEAPSTPVIASGSSKHQSMLWASIAGAFMALSMLSV